MEKAGMVVPETRGAGIGEVMLFLARRGES